MSLHESAVAWVAELLHAPRLWVEAGALLVASLVAAWLVRRLILMACERVAARTATPLDDVLLGTVASPAALTVVLLGALSAAGLLWTGPEAELVLSRLLTTGLVLVWGVAVGRLIGQALRQETRHLPGLARTRGAVVLGRFANVVVSVVALLTLLGLWDVDITPLLASAGLVGIALALAAQDTLSNFFAGVAVYMDRLYQPGDYVVLDPGSESEIRGEVRDVGLRSTRILTRDDVLVVVPNSVIANGRVVNETGQSTQYRVRVGVSVAYASDLDHVERVLDGVAAGHPLVLPDPLPRSRVRRFNESGIDCELLAWIADPRDRGLVVHDLSKAVHKRFREEGIVIPFPQRDIHVQAPGPAPEVSEQS